MKPVIGISCSFDYQESWYYLRQTYVESIINAGGTPVVLPAHPGTYSVEDYILLCDGFVLSGGGDMDPACWGAEPHPRLGEVDPVRDEFELMLTRRIMQENKPGLFICRGIQVLNVAAGGTLIQNIKSDILHRQKAPRYHPWHDVIIDQGSLLYQLAGQDTLRVNSFHHQALRKIGPGLNISSRARDGIVESVEMADRRFIMGIQWHPEAMRDQLSTRLFQELIKASAKG